MRLEVKDITAVNDKVIKSAGVAGVIIFITLFINLPNNNITIDILTEKRYNGNKEI